MSVLIQVCKTCGHKYFPSRRRCQQCWGTHFSNAEVKLSIVSGVIEVHRPASQTGWRWLIQFDVDAGVSVIAVSKACPKVGEMMTIEQMENGAIYAS